MNTTNNKRLDFSGLNSKLLSQAESLLFQWFPQGKILSREFKIGSISGEAGESLSVNLNTGKWADFAAGTSGGDLISLYQTIHNIKPLQAYQELGGVTNKEPKPTVVSKVTYKYNDDYFVLRQNLSNGKKKFSGNYKGEWKHPPDPRPLYKPNGLKKQHVLIVEGEKSALAAVDLLGNIYSVISWPMGSNNWSKADWSEVQDKDVLFWPDCDDPGYEAMFGVLALLKPKNRSVAFLDVKKSPQTFGDSGWDAYDVGKVLNIDQVLAWAKPLKQEIKDMPKEQALLPANTHKEKPKTSHSLAQIDPENFALMQDLELKASTSGRIYGTQGNAMICVKHHPYFKDRFFYDTFYNQIMTISKGKYRRLHDTDYTDAVIFLQNKLGIDQMRRSSVIEAIEFVAHANQRSEPKNWMMDLKWDGTSRLERFFFDYMVASDDMPKKYLKAVGKNFFVSMVARVFYPGCKFDNMLILEGHQGIRKSSALEIIGDRWHGETMGQLGSKDYFESVQGKFLIEMQEIVEFLKASPELQKATLSLSRKSYRKAYARHAEETVLQCIFVGTTNRQDYLNDNTGLRRYWPVHLDSINYDDIRRDRDQLFAEAVVLYNQMYKFWEVPEDEADFVRNKRNIAQSSRDPWFDAIETTIQNAAWDGHLTTEFILNEIVKRPLDMRTKNDSMRIGKIMREMGYSNERLGSRSERFYAWVRNYECMDTPLVPRQIKSVGPQSRQDHFEPSY